jgi:hypothetical protein
VPEANTKARLNSAFAKVNRSAGMLILAILVIDVKLLSAYFTFGEGVAFINLCRLGK